MSQTPFNLEAWLAEGTENNAQPVINTMANTVVNGQPFDLQTWLYNDNSNKNVTGLGTNYANAFNAQLAERQQTQEKRLDPIWKMQQYNNYANSLANYYSLQGYTPEQINTIKNEFASLADPREQKTWGDRVKDNLFYPFASGTLSLAGDAVGAVSDTLAQPLRDAAKDYDKAMSDEAQITTYLAEQQRQQNLANGMGDTMATLNFLKDDPVGAWRMLVSSAAPQMLLAAGTGGTSLVATNALAGAGSYRNTIKEAYQGISPERAMQLPEVRERLAQGMSLEEAIKDASTDISDNIGGILAATAVGAGTALTPMGKFGQGVNQGVLKTMGKETLGEYVQEGAQKFVENLGKGYVDGKTQPMDDVLHNALIGGTMGFAMGIPAGVEAYRNGKAQQRADERINNLSQTNPLYERANQLTDIINRNLAGEWVNTTGEPITHSDRAQAIEEQKAATVSELHNIIRQAGYDPENEEQLEQFYRDVANYNQTRQQQEQHESAQQAQAQTTISRQIDHQALDRVLEPYKDAEDYKEIKAELERDIKDGVLEQRLQESDPNYAPLVQAYLTATGQMLQTTAQNTAQSAVQNQQENVPVQPQSDFVPTQINAQVAPSEQESNESTQSQTITPESQQQARTAYIEAVKSLKTVTDKIEKAVYDNSNPESQAIFNQHQAELIPAVKALNEATKNLRQQGLDPEKEFADYKAKQQNEAQTDRALPQTLPTQAQPRELIGAQDTVDIGDNQYQPFTYKIVEASSLAPTQDKADNQFRDRNRVASREQVNHIARNLDPRKITDSPTMDMGAPLLANDGTTIIAGNGRSMAVQQAYTEGNGENYRQHLAQNASKFGINAEELNQFEQPVLVRQLNAPVDIQQTAINSNVQAGIQMSDLEQAKVDAQYLPDLSLLSLDENGNLNSPSNRGFVTQFIQNAPQQARNALLDSKGNLSQTGVSRVRNALLFAAYGDSNTLARLIENTDQGAKNILNALIKLAPTVAQTKQDVANGTLSDVDISSDIVQAVEKYDQLTRQNARVDEYLAQEDFVGDLTPEAKEVLKILDENRRSGKRIAEILNAYYQQAQVQGNAQQTSMFEEEPFDKMGTLQQAKNAEDGSLFSRSPMKSVEANIARGRERMTKAIVEQADVKRGMYHPEFGWVDFVWGDDGTTKGVNRFGEPRGRGLAHIFEARQRKDGLSEQQVTEMLTNDIVETIAKGKGTPLERNGVTKLALNYTRPSDGKTHRVILTKEKGSNAWVLSGYEVFEGANGQGTGRSTSTTTAPTPPRGDTGASNLASGSEQFANGDSTSQLNDTHRHSQGGRAVVAENGQTVTNSDSAVNPQIAQDQATLERLLGKETAAHIEIVSSETKMPNGRTVKEIHNDEDGEVEGWYDPQTQKIYLVSDNITARGMLSREENLAWVAWHELAHNGVRVKYGEEFERLLQSAGKHPLVRQIAEKIKANYGKMRISDTVAVEEALVEIFSAETTQNWAELASRYKVDVARWQPRTKGFLSRVAERLKVIMSKVVRRNLLKTSDTELFEILGNIRQGIQSQEKTDVNSTALNNESRYSLNEREDSDFARAVDDVVNGNVTRGYIHMGTTPDVLKMLGLPDTKIRIQGKTIEKVMGEYLGIEQGKHSHIHNLTPETLKSLPKNINDPVAIFRSSTTNNGYVVLTELNETDVQTGKHKPVVAALHLKSAQGGVEIIDVASVYGRSDNQLSRAFENDTLYLNKEKAQYLNTERLQLPWDFTSDVELSGRNIKTETDLSQYRAENNQSDVRYSRSQQSELTQSDYDQALKAGKTELSFDQWKQVRTPEFKRWFGDWENDPENASKVVNPKTGEPLVVYHGTDANFTVFDTQKLGKNGAINGVGFYFSSDEEYAQYYGKSDAYYLNIRQPFSLPENRSLPSYVSSEIGFTKKQYTEMRKRGSKEFERQVATELVKRKGYDGVVSGTFTEIVAFNPNQIKSATDNNGDFEAENDDIRYSLRSKSDRGLSEDENSEFAKAVDEVVNGVAPNGRYVDMGTTPEVLKMLGLPDTNIRITDETIHKIMSEYLGYPKGNRQNIHNLTPKTVKQLPQQLNNPVAVFKSSTRKDAYVVLTELFETKTKTGRDEPVIAAMHVKPVKGGVEVVNVTSAYGRGDSQLERAFNNDLLYVNKTKAQQVLNTQSLQLGWDFTSDVELSARDVKTETDLSQYQSENNQYDIRYSRKQSVLTDTEKGRFDTQKPTWIDDLRTRNFDSFKEKFGQALGKVDEWITDGTRPVKDWLSNFGKMGISDREIAELRGELDLAKGIRDNLNVELERQYLKPIIQSIADIAAAGYLNDGSKMEEIDAKRMLGYWISARYAIEKNNEMLAREKQAMEDALQALIDAKRQDIHVTNQWNKAVEIFNRERAKWQEVKIRKAKAEKDYQYAIAEWQQAQRNAPTDKAYDEAEAKWNKAEAKWQEAQNAYEQQKQAYADASQARREARDNKAKAEKSYNLKQLERDYRTTEAQYRQRKHDVELPLDSDEDFQVGTAGGWSNAEARAIMANIENHIARDKLESAAETVYDLNQARLEIDYSAGRYTQEQYDQFRQNRHYVPLTGKPYSPMEVNTEEVNDGISGAGQNAVNVSKDRALKGRKLSEAEDGIDASWRAINNTTTYAGWAEFKNHLDDIYERKVAELESNGYSEQDARNEVAKNLGIEKKTMQGMTRPNDNVLIRKAGNVYYEYSLPPKVIEALKKDNAEKSQSWMSIIQTPTGWYARGVTQWTLTFAPMNMLRDTWEKSEFIRVQEIYDQNGDLLDNKTMDKIGWDVIKNAVWNSEVWRATKRFGFEQAFDQSEEGQMLKQLLKAGGLSTYSTYLASTERDLIKQVKKRNNVLAIRLEQVGNLIEGYNKTFDTVSALAAYKALRDNGVDEKQAAAVTLELTNFRKTGSKMRWVKALYMFAQPTAMGGRNLLKYLNTPKGAKRFAAYVAAGVVLYSLLRAFDDDDEGGNRTDELGDITRYIPFPTGTGHFFKFPVAYGMPQLAWNASVNLVKTVTRDISPTEAAVNIGVNAMKNVVPVSPSEISAAKYPGAKLALTLTPTILQPIMQNIIGRTAFGSPIGNNFTSDKKLKADQARTTTAPFWTDVAHFLSDNLGIDMYPEEVKNLVDGYTPMLGSMKDISTVLVENPNRERLGRQTRIPFLNTFIAPHNEFAIQSRYFEASEEAKRINQEYESRKSRGKLEGWVTPEIEQIVRWHKLDGRQMDQVRAQKSKVTKAYNEKRITQERYDEFLRKNAKQNDRVQRNLLHSWREMQGLNTEKTQ